MFDVHPPNIPATNAFDQLSRRLVCGGQQAKDNTETVSWVVAVWKFLTLHRV